MVSIGVPPTWPLTSTWRIRIEFATLPGETLSQRYGPLLAARRFNVGTLRVFRATNRLSRPTEEPADQLRSIATFRRRLGDPIRGTWPGTKRRGKRFCPGSLYAPRDQSVRNLNSPVREVSPI